MPAPRTDIDESGIAARVALQGIRPTAKATGLPSSTVRDIAKRQGVKVPDQAMRLVPVTPPMAPRPHSLASAQLSAQPPHAVITDELTRLGSDGRLYAARVGVGVLRHHAGTLEADPEAVSARIDEAVGATKLLQNGNVPGWERQATSTEQHSHLHLHQAVRPDGPSIT